MNDRKLQIHDKWISEMFDRTISRNPLHRNIVIIENEILRDQYQDSFVQESGRFLKNASVKKASQNFTQFFEIDELSEDITDTPWEFTFTQTGLTRIPRTDDRILMGGILYTISKVKPFNRETPTLVTALAYTERDLPEDVIETAPGVPILPVLEFSRLVGFNFIPVTDFSVLEKGDTIHVDIASRGFATNILVETTTDGVSSTKTITYADRFSFTWGETLNKISLSNYRTSYDATPEYPAIQIFKYPTP